MNTNTTSEERKFKLNADELSHWNENGYFVRFDVFTKEENDILRQIADDIVDGKQPFPDYHIFLRFRRANIAHYVSAKAEWTRPEAVNKKRPPMWIRGQTYPGMADEVQRDVIPIPESD